MTYFSHSPDEGRGNAMPLSVLPRKPGIASRSCLKVPRKDFTNFVGQIIASCESSTYDSCKALEKFVRYLGLTCFGD